MSANDHLLTCGDKRGATMRHNVVEHELKKMAEELGIPVIAQPPLFDPESGEKRDPHKKADLLLHLPTGSPLFIDVAVCTPTAMSHLDRPHSRIAMDETAKEKKEKYDHLTAALAHATNRPLRFLPFVMEVYGAMHSSAEEVLEEFDAAARIHGVRPMSDETN